MILFHPMASCWSCRPDCGACPDCGDTQCTKPEECFTCWEDCDACPSCNNTIQDPGEFSVDSGGVCPLLEELPNLVITTEDIIVTQIN